MTLRRGVLPSLPPHPTTPAPQHPSTPAPQHPTTPPPHNRWVNYRIHPRAGMLGLSMSCLKTPLSILASVPLDCLISVCPKLLLVPTEQFCLFCSLCSEGVCIITLLIERKSKMPPSIFPPPIRLLQKPVYPLWSHPLLVFIPDCAAVEHVGVVNNCHLHRSLTNKPKMHMDGEGCSQAATPHIFFLYLSLHSSIFPLNLSSQQSSTTFSLPLYNVDHL